MAAEPPTIQSFYVTKAINFIRTSVCYCKKVVNIQWRNSLAFFSIYNTTSVNVKNVKRPLNFSKCFEINRLNNSHHEHSCFRISRAICAHLCVYHNCLAFKADTKLVTETRTKHLRNFAADYARFDWRYKEKYNILTMLSIQSN